MRRIHKALAAAALLGAWSALAQAPVESRHIGAIPNVVVEADDKADFAHYKTYAWMPITERPANFADHTRIMQTIEKELAKKGFSKDDKGTPDIFVGYSASTKKKVRGESYTQNPNRGPGDQRTLVDFKKVEEQTLSIEFRDGKSREPVFTGTLSEPLQRSDLVAYQLTDAVKKIIASYPPGQDEGAPPVPSPAP